LREDGKNLIRRKGLRPAEVQEIIGKLLRGKIGHGGKMLVADSVTVRRENRNQLGAKVVSAQMIERMKGRGADARRTAIQGSGNGLPIFGDQIRKVRSPSSNGRTVRTVNDGGSELGMLLNELNQR